MNVKKLLADYSATAAYIHSLAEIRFKLLALVPVVTGLAVSTLEKLPGEASTAVALLGTVATLGILFYDQRNTEIYDALQVRAKTLEALLGLPTSSEVKVKTQAGERVPRLRAGAFLDRPKRQRHFFFVVMWHDLGLALIYAASLSCWSYLLLRGHLPDGILEWHIPALVFLLVLWRLVVLDRKTDVGSVLLPDVRVLLAQAPEQDQ